MEKILEYVSRKFKKIILFVIPFSLLLPYFTVRTSAEPSISVSAESAVLLEPYSGEIVYEKNAHDRMPMASTTKIMTAIVALENTNIDSEIKISTEAVGVEGSSVYLRAGEMLTVRELVTALLLESANDAAAALAIGIGGSIEDFAGMMNNKAQELGLSDTHFVNPHGLDDIDHYTTAADLAKLTAYCLKNQTFRKIVSTERATIRQIDGEGVRYLVNHNKMLWRYPGAVGVKTGFTKISGRCLVSAATRQGVTLVAVTLNAPDDWNDHKKMLDAGFDMFDAVIPDGSSEFIMPLIGGSADCVITACKQPESIILKKCHGKITRKVEMPRFSFAPVECGQTLGRVVYYCDGKEILSIPITALYSVEKAAKHG